LQQEINIFLLSNFPPLSHVVWAMVSRLFFYQVVTFPLEVTKVFSHFQDEIKLRCSLILPKKRRGKDSSMLVWMSHYFSIHGNKTFLDYFFEKTLHWDKNLHFVS
jgi:hypothetical protein